MVDPPLQFILRSIDEGYDKHPFYFWIVVDGYWITGHYINKDAILDEEAYERQESPGDFRSVLTAQYKDELADMVPAPPHNYISMRNATIYYRGEKLYTTKSLRVNLEKVAIWGHLSFLTTHQK